MENDDSFSTVEAICMGISLIFLPTVILIAVMVKELNP